MDHSNMPIYTLPKALPPGWRVGERQRKEERVPMSWMGVMEPLVGLFHPLIATLQYQHVWHHIPLSYFSLYSLHFLCVIRVRIVFFFLFREHIWRWVRFECSVLIVVYFPCLPRQLPAVSSRTKHTFCLCLQVGNRKQLTWVRATPLFMSDAVCSYPSLPCSSKYRKYRWEIAPPKCCRPAAGWHSHVWQCVTEKVSPRCYLLAEVGGCGSSVDMSSLGDGERSGTTRPRTFCPDQQGTKKISGITNVTRFYWISLQLEVLYLLTWWRSTSVLCRLFDIHVLQTNNC